MALKGESILGYVGISCSEEMSVEPRRTRVHKIEYAEKYFAPSQARTYKQGVRSSRDQFITSLEVNLIKNISRHISQPSKLTHLDIATGSGRIIGQLESFFKRSMGLDTSKEMIEFAKSEAKISSFFRGDSENLPFNANSFDMVTCFRLFINLSKTGRKKFLLDCKRILTDQGILVVDNHCNKISITGILGALRSKLTTNRNDPYRLYSLMTPIRFERELQTAGFVPIAKLYSFFPSISKIPFISTSIRIAMDTCLSRLPVIKSFADLIMIVACKQ
jgi:ubiquinone/menaquinone biosynthesis C-methylase UbiE